MSIFTNKKVLILGMGKSGVAVLDYIYGETHHITVYDEKDLEITNPELFLKLKNLNIVSLLNSSFKVGNEYDYVFISPGFNVLKDVVQEAISGGAVLMGELELASLVAKGEFIGITGTNGKTTTTTLIYKILKDGSNDVIIGGNIGVPVTALLDKTTKKTLIVTEISSFQLQTTNTFRPKVSLLLNITEDHMDIHGSIKNYADAKGNIFSSQTENDFIVYNDDDELVKKQVKRNEKPYKLKFSVAKELSEGLFLKENKIILKIKKTIKNHKYFSSSQTYEIMDISEIKLKGEHNLQNILGSIGVCLSLETDIERIKEVISNFEGVEHRLEKVLEMDGKVYYNDSKGTNPDSTIKAINALKENIHIILGGYDKNANYDDLFKAMQGKIKTAYLFGATKNKLKEKFDETKISNYEVYNSLKECVLSASLNAKNGDYILLSPAHASWDMYKSFEERGMEFKNIVFSLKQNEFK